jgi:hypothetical protein
MLTTNRNSLKFYPLELISTDLSQIAAAGTKNCHVRSITQCSKKNRTKIQNPSATSSPAHLGVAYGKEVGHGSNSASRRGRGWR